MILSRVPETAETRLSCNDLDPRRCCWGWKTAARRSCAVNPKALVVREGSGTQINFAYQLNRTLPGDEVTVAANRRVPGETDHFGILGLRRVVTL